MSLDVCLACLQNNLVTGRQGLAFERQRAKALRAINNTVLSGAALRKRMQLDEQACRPRRAPALSWSL